MPERVRQQTISEIEGKRLTRTISELEDARLGHIRDHDIEIVVDGGKHHRNVFQRMSDAFRRVLVTKNRLKWPMRPRGARGFDESRHNFRS